jgi:hypothetical protein
MGKAFVTLLKKVKNHQRIKQMIMKQNQLNPLNPLTISGFFRGVICEIRTFVLFVPFVMRIQVSGRSVH